MLETGVFASLDNQVDTTTGTVRAKARFANSQMSLFPSQFVNVQLLVRTIENAVVVPVTALRQGTGGDYVYVLDAAERTVSLRPVTRGQATVDRIVIATGLQAGERVITEGADRLKDGARVALAGDAPRGGGAGGGGRRRQAASAPQDPSTPSSGSSSSPAAPAPSAPSAAAPPAAAGGQSSNGPAQSRSPGPGSSNTPPAATSPAAVVPAISDGPSPQQRERMLAQVKDDPVALERRQKFFEKLNQKDPEAITRWRAMMERRAQGDRPSQ